MRQHGFGMVQELTERVRSFSNVRALLIGDLILDRYLTHRDTIFLRVFPEGDSEPSPD